MADTFESSLLKNPRAEFIEMARQERAKRDEERKRFSAVLTIQKAVREFLVRRKIKRNAVNEFEKLMEKFDPEGKPVVDSQSIFTQAIIILNNFNFRTELEVLEKLCRYVNWSLGQPKPQYSYIGCGFPRDQVLPWIEHLKNLVLICSKALILLKPELVVESKRISVILNTIVSLTSIHGWEVIKSEEYKALKPGMEKLSLTIFNHLLESGVFYENLHVLLKAGMARPDRFFINKANLLAIDTLSLRPITKSMGTIYLKEYIQFILTVPAYTYFLDKHCGKTLSFELQKKVVESMNPDLREYYSVTELFADDLTDSLSLFANLVYLAQYQAKWDEEFHPLFMTVTHLLMDVVLAREENSKSRHWHPMIGWVPTAIPTPFMNSSSCIRKQVDSLWNIEVLNVLFSPLYEVVQYTKGPEANSPNESAATSSGASSSFEKERVSPVREKKASFKSSFAKMFRKTFSIEHNKTPETECAHIKFDSIVTLRISMACAYYNKIIKTFPQCRLDILTGLCFKQSSKFISCLWSFLVDVDDCGFKSWVDLLLQPGIHLSKTKSANRIQEALLVMFADAMTHFITILDDQELYEDQAVFRISQLSTIANFVNTLCYRLISNDNHGTINPITWSSLKTLLMVLYRRDCRRRFCPEHSWLIDLPKVNMILFDAPRNPKGYRRVLNDMPHIIKEESRVMLFRKWVNSEKALQPYAVGCEHQDLPVSHISSTLITIQRGRIVEDGYAQLANLSPKALKATIRVRFQNEHGLDEAGIDQDGVFKEFLEETINAVFNPGLNLFKVTNEFLLYPSPSSYLHENHLQLFEFVGKMLAKAIYEGIVVDVHFAPFFLSQILGYQTNALFSAIDELQSLDRELYNSLTYIKHYDGNVQDLELTFSVDQDVLGEIKTTELIPGGRSVAVTNDNKISYLYMMAHFHSYLQIKDQTASFLKGFRSIIPYEWIRIFSPPELQRLISGEDTNLDIAEMRRYTQYYGGFHDNHRVIIWLWEILENDFDERERRLFLKFVTSCSKPPLLGFGNLEPPFSIRCVEVGDDEDTGDTIGSVLRGFLTIGRKDPITRLPTSSTCFNLLKLPNYQKRTTLRDKLKYAITANVGFELS